MLELVEMEKKRDASEISEGSSNIQLGEGECVYIYIHTHITYEMGTRRLKVYDPFPGYVSHRIFF